MRLLDTAEIKDIKSLISNENKLNIRINFYQRPYRWTAKKVTDLFEDYRENRDSAEGGNNPEYFLGAVVLVDERTQEEKSNGKLWKYQVVDGQQRITTLFLFNYIKYMLLIRKVDLAARSFYSDDFSFGRKAMEDCYRGFIGTSNVSIIENANRILKEAYESATRSRGDISSEVMNTWRTQVGWIDNPIISDINYYDNCCLAMTNFIQNETLSIKYQNADFNSKLKEALSKIVIRFGDTSDAELCDEPVEDYDENDETHIEFPYVIRAYGIFDQIKKMCAEAYPEARSPYEKLCKYIELIDEMLENIKLCMIVTSDEDDAYKLFETLNDRSESVSDLELLKNYFFKTYTETSGDDPATINSHISSLDSRWRDIFYDFEELKPEIFEYMPILFSHDTSKNTNERKRKLIKRYLSEYSDSTPNERYTFQKIDRDFTLMLYIQKILLRIHQMDMATHRKKAEDEQLSLYIENDSSSSTVKRALGLALNIPYPVIVGSLICDVLHNFYVNGQAYTFDSYLDCVFSENDCKDAFPGLWKDACVMWKAIILSKNYESPKTLSDELVSHCNISQFSVLRDASLQVVQFGASTIE